jgi:hypothetical protein
MLLVLVTSALFTDCRSGKKKSNPITEEVIATDHFIRVGKSGGITGVITNLFIELNRRCNVLLGIGS